MMPPFKEAKTAQAAALLLQLAGGQMSYMKLIKLLYLADRRALVTWGRPVTCDRWVSMKNGPVLSNTLNLIKKHPPGEWRQLVSKATDYEVRLKVAEPPHDRLSEAEVKLLKQVHRKFGHVAKWDLVDIVHTLPEWRDPGQSMFPINPEDILRAEKWSDEDIKAVLCELDAVAHSERVLEPVA